MRYQDNAMLLAIDPGNVKSAYVLLDKITYKLVASSIVENTELKYLMDIYDWEIEDVAIEMITGFNMSVGQTVFDTCVWIGRLAEKAINHSENVVLIPRKDIKLHLCNNRRAKDKDIIAALVDRFAPDTKNYGKGTKKDKGYFYNFKADIWSAFAVAVTYMDWQKDNRLIPKENLQFIKSI